ncbi:hypothetical protein [Nocardioides bruguierae]|uniref:Uncharacterized protein n=1 Tax=Nocardioides bruguierae TaxID=2945102 RepID=A0A9X2ICJ2_9ACTN|nr:hypothetical protein [Nocardioides bruguierae]MCM0618771.1 hypothetical protein [Nocardioides bruguierae]
MAGKSTSSAGRRRPSAEERRGKRGHDEHGNVRPADGRFELHDPAQESSFVSSTKASKTSSKTRPTRGSDDG